MLRWLTGAISGGDGSHPTGDARPYRPAAGGFVSNSPGAMPLHGSLGGQVPRTEDASNFGAHGPFFRVIREGLEGLADAGLLRPPGRTMSVVEYVVSVARLPHAR